MKLTPESLAKHIILSAIDDIEIFDITEMVADEVHDQMGLGETDDTVMTDIVEPLAEKVDALIDRIVVRLEVDGVEI